MSTTETNPSIQLDLQSYLEELITIKVEVLTQLKQGHDLVKFVKQMTSVFMIKNIDLTYEFLKTFQKQIKKLANDEAAKDLCEFVL